MKEIPVADPCNDLEGIDGLIVETPSRFGNMTAQMRNFLRPGRRGMVKRSAYQ